MNVTISVPETSTRVLYVMEGECACNIPDDQFDYIGSDDATTCHIVLARSNSSKFMMVTHLTCSDNCFGMNKIIESLGDDVDIYVFGGLNDELSKQITTSLLEVITLIDKIKYCIKEMKVNENHIVLNKGYFYPISYGYGFHKTSANNWTVSPMFFPMSVRGPNMILRQASSYDYNDSNEITIVYNGRVDLYFHIKYFIIPVMFYDKLLRRLNLDDTTYLKYFSTSPYVEPNHFVANSKKCIQWILDNNVSKSFVRNDRTLSDLLYRMDIENGWILCE